MDVPAGGGRSLMCGITAAIGPGHAALAQAVAGQLHHRGPDGEGARSFDGCTLAMTRLAILDTSSRADQPMSRGPLHLVYNGEIYNHAALRAELQGFGESFASTG